MSLNRQVEGGLLVGPSGAGDAGWLSDGSILPWRAVLVMTDSAMLAVTRRLAPSGKLDADVVIQVYTTSPCSQLAPHAALREHRWARMCLSHEGPGQQAGG